MTERENVLRAIYRTGDPEWVPVSSEAIFMIVPSALLERPQNFQSGKDWFGCEWIFDKATMGYVQDPTLPFPISDICNWREEIQFPDLDIIDWEACAKKDLENYDREERLLSLFWESGPFERTHALLGFENAFLAMYDEPEEFKALISAVTDFRLSAFEKAAEYYQPDIIFSADDLGSQNGGLMSVDMYREFIKPSHARIGAKLEELGIIYQHHSCGKMQEFIGDLIEAGAKIIQPLQAMNDGQWVEETYGDQVSIQGGFGVMVHRPETTEEELIGEVHRVIDLFAPYKNFIFQPNSLIPENLKILREESIRYGKEFYKH